jgi:hypothetical protein
VGPLIRPASTHVMLSPGPSVLVRPVGRHVVPEPRTAQELPTMCSMIAVVETDGVRGR